MIKEGTYVCCVYYICCICRRNLDPGSMGGIVCSKLLNGHYYCYRCFPQMVDVYIADQKLKDFAAPETSVDKGTKEKS